MNDTERAIETIKMENELMQFDPMTGEDYPIELQNRDNQDLYNANLVVISALEKQLNGGWIPASETLPSNTQRVLVTLENKMVLEVFYINNKFKFIGIVEGGGMKEIFKDNPVIAWQPLPEPYKEVEKAIEIIKQEVGDETDTI